MSNTESAAKPLRIGLLLDRWTVPQWVARVINDIERAPFASIELIVLNETAQKPRSTGRVFERRRELLWRAYMAVDARLFRPQHNPFKRVDVLDSLEHVPVVRVAPSQKRFSDRFSEETLTEIGGYDLDVVFRFGFRILRGGALNIARHGVWSFHHGDNEVNRGTPACFWEVVKREPVSGSILQVLSEDLDNGRVLYRSWSSTHPYSVTANRARVYNKTAAFAIRKLRELYETGIARSDCAASAYKPYSRPLYRTPGNLRMLPIVARLGGRVIRAAVDNIVHREAWHIEYKLHNAPQLPARLYDFKRLVPRRGGLWADPFPVTRDGRHFIFFEDWPRGARHAHVSVVEVMADGSTGVPRIALKQPYHLSYPFVFVVGDEWFMVPETKANRRVELYRCTRFPDEWQLDTVLLDDIEAVDATLHHADGLWWMWLSMAEPGASSLDEVHLFYADDLRGPWQAHARNPVTSDVRRARPAGRIFQVGDRLIRPAQDGSVRYGYAITFNRIIRMTQTEYQEEPYAQILPCWDDRLLGTHTFNADGALTTIDAFHKHARWL